MAELMRNEGDGAGVAPATAPPPTSQGPRLRLVALSGLMLFIELALIRWTGSNVLHLSYFSNFVLLGSFLGIGLGFLRAGRRGDLFVWAPLALAALVAFVRFFPVEVTRSGDDLIFFGGGLESSGPPRALVLSVIFVAVAATMAFIGEGVARTFVQFAPLEAYRFDILGSVSGIVAFSVLSFLRAPPVVWGAIAGIGLLLLLGPRLRSAVGLVQVGAVAAIVVILAIESLSAGSSWSPYYKVTLDEEPTPFVEVNGVPHQALFEPGDNPIYEGVYRRVPDLPLDDVLIIGAGGGNDVALALEKGARRIDAVEIDPRLHEIGTDLHPSKPWEDPRVESHIDDGRAYLERTDEKYDLILFALPDSITLVAGQSALRLESYLFTRQAIETAQDRLKPGGAFAMYNYYREPWLEDRLGGMLTSVFGRPPCQDTVGDVGRLAIFVSSNDADAVACDAVWESSTDPQPDAATDDWPFPYLRERSLPLFYVATAGAILAVSLLAVRGVGGPLRPMRPYLDLFFMGAAFLLLETKNLVQFALLFGTTWFVNALVFAGVLVSVLCAIEVSRRRVFRRPARLYIALLVAVAVALTVPASALLSLPVGLRFVAAAALAFAPIFLANLVFAERFRDVDKSAAAFGANLLGAMVGGLVEYAALITGYRALLVLVAVLYGLAFLAGRRHLSAPAAAGA